jgi:hypothetical protein
MAAPADDIHEDDDEGILVPFLREGRDAEPHVSPHLQRQIGQSLQAMYADLLDQPVPDHLIDLVKRLNA